jgi:hypothetical protein
MDPNERGWDCVHWIHLVQGRNQRLVVVNTVMNIRIL